MGEMRFVLVAGSGKLPLPERMVETSRRLGEQLARAGFGLVTGGWDGVDALVAEAFARELQRIEVKTSGRLVHILKRGEIPAFAGGEVIATGSDDEAWDLSIRRADAVVLVGGLGGTAETGRRARERGKPVLPLADTADGWKHQDAKRFHLLMRDRWEADPIVGLTREDFIQLANPAPEVVADAIGCLGKIFSPRGEAAHVPSLEDPRPKGTRHEAAGGQPPPAAVPTRSRPAPANGDPAPAPPGPPTSADALTWDFFIAHASSDRALAEELYDALQGASRVFLDTRCLELGDDWDLRLPREQRAALVTVVLVSGASELAYYQREEVAAALDLARRAGQRHRVVPIYVDEAAASREGLPYGLRLKQGLTLSASCKIADAAKLLLGLLARTHRALAEVDPVPEATQALRGPRADQGGIFLWPPETWVSPVRTNRRRYKLVAFDLDGTLLRGPTFDFSWELVWRSLGFGREIQSQLKREYRQKSDGLTRGARVTAYERWCTKAVEHFVRRRLTRQQLRDMASGLTLTGHCREALSALRSEGMALAIVSGGIQTFLEDAFPDYRDFVDFVFINELTFVESGVLSGVRATAYDFQGKAEALDLVSVRVGCTAEEAVFVGDHFNDEEIMLRVDKAIAYPPHDAAVDGTAHVRIEKDDLREILPHVLTD